jgi:hypothetical protein
MIDWSSVSDEEFIEQANIRTAQGHWSPDRFMTQFQSDDRAKLGVLRSARGQHDASRAGRQIPDPSGGNVMRKAGFHILAAALITASLISCASREDQYWSDIGAIVDQTQPKRL